MGVEKEKKCHAKTVMSRKAEEALMSRKAEEALKHNEHLLHRQNVLF